MIPDENWKILIIDDEEDVHSITKMVLHDFIYEDKKLDFFSAYSAKEARKIINNLKNIAVILLDVVMETDDAGLRLAEYIRNDLNLKDVRIILRTGQPGYAPERYVIDNYDIDGYRTKADMTSQRLYTTIRSAIKNYYDIQVININRRGLRKIVDSSGMIFKLQSLDKFISGVLEQIISLLSLNKSELTDMASGFAAYQESETMIISAGAGIYKKKVGKQFEFIENEEIKNNINRALIEKKNLFYDNYSIIVFQNNEHSNTVFYIESNCKIDTWSKELLETFCTNVTIALDNIWLNKEIEDTQKEIIFMLGSICETRSKETSNHVIRVAEYSKLIALKYGLDEKEAEIIKLASPMHDIGKIGIIDAILNKKGKLTKDEFEAMKLHSNLGFDLLKPSKRNLLKAAAIISREHHERYDGSGYPIGLSGKDIHVYGRITALADVFDALGSDRVYKKAWEINKIIQYIKEERGKHFDPELVDIFIANIDKFLAIRDRYKDIESETPDHSHQPLLNH